MADRDLFAVIAIDGEGGTTLRAQLRAHHLAYIERNKHRVALAGPFLDDQRQPVGSLYLLAVDSEEQARSFIASDPYCAGNLFESVAVRPWRLVIDNIHSDAT